MDEVAITSQLTSYDKFLHTLSQVDNRHNWPQNRYYAAVVVPPKEPDTKEKWVAVSPVAQYPGQIGTATGRAVVEGAQWDIFADVKQPDPERNAICGGGGENGCCFWLCYWYADELPRCIALAVIFAVILSIFTTPLVLICFVPMIRRMVKAQHEINEGDIPAARRHWVTACQWPYFGMVIWIAIVLPFVLVGLITGIALGVVLSQ